MVLSGCGDTPESSDELDKVIEENQELQETITELEEQIAEMPSGSEQTGTVEAVDNKYAIGIDCKLYEEGSDASTASNEIAFTDSLSFTAVFDAEDAALDYWIVNGEIQDTADLSTTVTDNTVIPAVAYQPLIVTSINADIQLLAENGNPEREKFQEYAFDEDGVISIYVSAVVPSGYEVDHWIIDGSPYYFSRAITYFKVFDLDKATTYEAVLKGASQASEPAPATPMVNVSCSNASFSGGGYSGASSGQVAKGTTITVTGGTPIGSPQYWLINGTANWSYGASFTYKVNSSTSFKYTNVN